MTEEQRKASFVVAVRIACAELGINDDDGAVIAARAYGHLVATGCAVVHLVDQSVPPRKRPRPELRVVGGYDHEEPGP